MNKQEFGRWTKLFDECYPDSKQMKTDISMQIWFNAFKDMSYEVAAQALSTTFMTEKFEPKTPAVIRGYAVVLADDSKEWSEAWEQVRHNVRFYGACTYDPDRLEECMKSFDELTRQTVKQLGWKDLCLSDSDRLETNRAQFRSIYETLHNRKKFEMASSLKIGMNSATEIEDKNNG